jgi:hypothetical protein
MRWQSAVVAEGDDAGGVTAEENAALIAEHLEAAGDLHAAYGWHMRPQPGRPTATSLRRD